MHSIRLPSILLALSLAGCSSSSSDADGPSPDAETKSAAAAGSPKTEGAGADAEADAEADAAGSPSDADPADPADPKTAEAAKPTEAKPVPASLRLAATREGPVDLLQSSGRAVLMLEGEPVPIVDGVPARQAGAGKGIASEFNPMDEPARAVAYAGDPTAPGEAWLTLVREAERTGPAHTTYRRLAEGWRPFELKDRHLVQYYAAYAQRQDTRFALRLWSSEPDEYWDDGDPQAQKKHEAFERALANAQPEWVALSKTATAAPQIPPGLVPFTAVTTDDHSLYALATVERDTTRPELVVWPAGAPQAQTVALPGAPKGVGQATLSSSGEWAVVTGNSEDDDVDMYLAVGRGKDWERIPVVLPERPENAPSHLFGAARTPSGEIWIAVGDLWAEGTPGQGIWRKAPAGAWQRVPLPSVDPTAFEDGSAWVRNPPQSGGGWSRVERPPVPSDATEPLGLIWGSGGVWITMDAGDAYPGADLYTEIGRTLVLTTAPGSGPAVALPSTLGLGLERHNEQAAGKTPGGDGCDQVSLILDRVPPSAEQVALADALLALEQDAIITQVYVGRRDGAEVFVVAAKADDEGAARKLAKAVSKASKAEAALDCRIPALTRMVKEG